MDEIIIPALLFIGIIIFISRIISASNRSRNRSENRSKLDNLAIQMNSLEEKLDELLKRTAPVANHAVTPVESEKKETKEYKIPEPSTMVIDESKSPVFEKIVPEISVPKVEIHAENEEPVPQDFTYTPQPGYEHLYEPSESWWTRFNKRNPDLEKFVGENLISKIGIAILVLGIAFFVKYAIDKDWINEYARVGIGILAGGIVLMFAHRLREKFKQFSSILVGGAIAIFYFTITIGFQEYKVFSQPVAFAIMIAITAFSVFISLAYNRQELAVLSLIGGFAAPFMVSTGDGNYKVLFSYLLILDAGMLVIAFARNWKLVYVLSYTFTLVIYGGWFFQKVQGQMEAPYLGALIFASLFYVTFFVMGIINNIRAKTSFKAADLSMILIFNFLFCGAGLTIFSNYHPELKGAFIIALSVFNFINSRILFRRFNADKTLVFLLIGLTMSYATLAAPIQLHGNYITLFWAAEAVVLMWLAQRSELKIFRFASVIVHLLMFISLVMDWQQIYFGFQEELIQILFNHGFVTSLVCLASLSIQIYLLRGEELELKYIDFNFSSKIYRNILIAMAFIVGYLGGFLELYYQLSKRMDNHDLMQILLAAYHYIFSAVVIKFVLNKNSAKPVFLVLILGFVNFALLLFNFGELPFQLLRHSIFGSKPLEPGFIIHFIPLLAFLYGTYELVNHIVTSSQYENSLKRFAYWLSAFLMVFILSGELMLNLSAFGFNPNLEVLNDATADVSLLYTHFQTQVLKTGFPILWGLIAFMFLTIGIRKQLKDLRIIALVLLAITLLKLFIYDIKEVSEAGKISAFILLGVLLLIMSFMYQKIKAIILDDEK